MAKQTEIKIKYSEAKVKALNHVLSKRNSNLNVEMAEQLEMLYKKYVKSDVREFIEEMEGGDVIIRRAEGANG